MCSTRMAFLFLAQSGRHNIRISNNSMRLLICMNAIATLRKSTLNALPMVLTVWEWNLLNKGPPISLAEPLTIP